MTGYPTVFPAPGGSRITEPDGPASRPDHPGAGAGTGRELHVLVVCGPADRAEPGPHGPGLIGPVRPPGSGKAFPAHAHGCPFNGLPTRIWKCALAPPAGRLRSRGRPKRISEAGDGGRGRGFHGRPPRPGPSRGSGGAAVLVALRDVRPRPFPGMPEMQLASRLHCVPRWAEGHPRQGVKSPSLY